MRTVSPKMYHHDRIGLYFVDGEICHVRCELPGGDFRKDTGIDGEYLLLVISLGADFKFNGMQSRPSSGKGEIPNGIYIDMESCTVTSEDWVIHILYNDPERVGVHRIKGSTTKAEPPTITVKKFPGISE